jgi:hypothetical protein
MCQIEPLSPTQLDVPRASRKLRPPLAPPVEPFHELFPPILQELIELEELFQLLGSDCFLVVDNRLAIPTETHRGADPGGFWV